MFKLILVSMLSWSLLSAAGASGCRTKQGTNLQDQKPLPSPVEKQMPGTSDLKILAEGFHSSINEPFIAVIRDAETYDGLPNIEGSLHRRECGLLCTYTW